MVKKMFSLVLISCFCFSPWVIADEASLSGNPLEPKLEKITEEAARTKELLEIWKDHVRTLTKERDEAYQQIETLKSASGNASLAGASGASPTHFGEIETQPLPPAAAMDKSPAPVSLNASDSAAVQKDFRGYQETIEQLRGQLDEIQTDNQRMKKEIMEAGNDKTLIIKDKDEAMTKIEDLLKQVNALKDENGLLTQRLQSAQSAPILSQVQPAAINAPASASGESLAFLQNAYNNQSVKLKQSLQDKKETIQLADELQKKYVDLQTAYDKLIAEPPVSAAPAVAAAAPATASQNLFELNHLKAQNKKLKNDLEALHAEAQKNALSQKSSENDLKNIAPQYEAKIAERDSENQALKDNLKQALGAQDELKAKLQSSASEISTLRTQSQDLTAENEKLKSYETELVSVQAQDKSLTEQLSALKAERDDLASKASDMSAIKEAKESAAKDIQNLQSENSELRSQIQRFRDDNEKSQAENTELDAKVSQMAALQTENQSLKTQLADVQASLSKNTDDLQSQNSVLKDQIEKSKEENEKNQAKIEELGSKISQIAQLQTENQSLKSRLSDSQVTDEALSGNFGKLKSQNETLETKNNSMTVELEALRTSLVRNLKSAQAEKSALLNQLERLKKENRKHSQELLSKENATTERFSEAQASAAALAAGMDNLKLKNQALETHNQSIEYELQSSKTVFGKNIEQLQAENDTLRAAKTSSDNDAEKLRSQNAVLADEIQKLKDENSSLKIGRDDLSAKVSEMDSLQTSYEAAKKDLAEANSQKDRLTGQNQEYQTQIASLKDEKNELGRQMADIKSQSDVLESSKVDLNRTLEVSRSENSRLTEENQKLQSEVQFANDESRKNLEAADSKVNAVREEKEALASQLEKMKTENQNLSVEAAKVPKVEIEKKYLQSIYSDLSYRIKRHQAAMGQALKKLEIMKTENQKLSGQIQEFNSQRLELQAENESEKSRAQSLAKEKQTSQDLVADLRSDLETLRNQNQKIKLKESGLNDKIESLEAAQADTLKQIDNLKSQLQFAEADKQKVQSLEAEKEKMLAESDTMKKAMVDLEHEAQANEDKVTGLNTQIADLRKTNDELQKTQDEQIKTIDTLKASLKQSLDDIQNLKSNFQSYLESLVSSFQDRQHKAAAASSNQ